MKYSKFAFMALVLACAVSAHAEGESYTALITSAQSTITGVITAVITAGSAILLAALGLKALPYAYHKIVGFFK